MNLHLWWSDDMFEHRVHWETEKPYNCILINRLFFVPGSLCVVPGSVCVVPGSVCVRLISILSAFYSYYQYQILHVLDSVVSLLAHHLTMLLTRSDKIKYLSGCVWTLLNQCYQREDVWCKLNKYWRANILCRVIVAYTCSYVKRHWGIPFTVSLLDQLSVCLHNMYRYFKCLWGIYITSMSCEKTQLSVNT